ncbi:MAG: molybdate ABC transporter substrate-binding protein [Gemmatimonas sp.]
MTTLCQLVAGLLLLILVPGARLFAQSVTSVAAASDLKFALEDVAKQYKASSGQDVRLTFGSSGNFFRQIQQGAPFDLFMSADEALVDSLAKQGHTSGSGVIYAVGRIVLFTPKGSTVKADEQFLDLRAALKDGRLRKFAIANPDHAPYGRAAREALISAGIWSQIERKLVLGENVSQAAQFAASGSTQGGIFALSLAISPAFRDAGSYVLIPDSLHKPLRQKMVLIKRAGTAAVNTDAQRFYDYLQSASARAVLRRYGFVLPGQ